MQEKEVKPFICLFEWKPEKKNATTERVIVEHFNINAIHKRIAFFWEFYRLDYYDVTVVVMKGDMLIMRLQTYYNAPLNLNN